MTALRPSDPIERLLALPAGGDLLERWQAGEEPTTSVEARPVAEGTIRPLDAVHRALLAHARVNPQQTLEAIAHLRGAIGGFLEVGDHATLRRLEGHCNTGLGRMAEADTAYRDAFEGFLSAGRRHDAGRTTIGWVHALTLAGDVEGADRVAATGRRLLPRSDRVSRARLDVNLAGAWLLSGRLERAAVRFEAARETFVVLGLPWDAAMCDHNLGMIAIMRADATRAAHHFSAALPGFRAAGLVQLELYAETGLASSRIIAGDWEGGITAFTELARRFDDLGDRRARSWLHRELASLFSSLGAVEVALPEAIAASDTLTTLGLHADAAMAALLAGRLLAASGNLLSARIQLTRARDHWAQVADPRARARAELELARLTLREGDARGAAKGLPALVRRLGAHDPTGDGARALATLAECHLMRGRHDQAEPLARQAYRAATRYPALLQRPNLALLVARTQFAAGRNRPALRWATRAVEELEETLTTFGSRSIRMEVGAARQPIYSEAVDLVLDAGGPRAVTTALDLLGRGRAAVMTEDLLQGNRDHHRTELQAAIGKLRDEVLSAATPDRDREARVSERIDALGARLARGARRTPAVIRSAMKSRGLDRWRRQLGRREVVVFDRGRAGWRAFVVHPAGGVDLVPLPELAEAIERTWVPLRLTFDAAARVEGERRQDFLARTQAESEAAMAHLRHVLWDPLPLSADRVTLVPTEDLHALPLEAIADGSGRVVTRLPHPALLHRPPRARGRDALLLHGGGRGARREVAAVARTLRGGGFTPRTGSRRRDLAGSDALAVLHVAAHGTFQRGGWLLSGIELADGWVGFEQLDRRRLRGALLHFTSCESGLAERMPGSDIEGWITAGLAAGARELVLTLWRIDDDAANAFSRAFYGRWVDGTDAGPAAAHARDEVRRHRPHPYSWASFIAVG